ncbi:MAG: RidA family protein [Hyphomicrobiales bacterium]
MMGKIDDRLAELGIEISEPAAPVANYVGYVVTGNLVFISGQVTLQDGAFKYQGKVGADFSVEEGAEAARLCGVNIIAQLKHACGGELDRVVRCVKLGGFVNSTTEFTQHPQVINGCSDLMVEVFGDKGKHARFALGAGSLPANVAVEVDAVFEIS